MRCYKRKSHSHPVPGCSDGGAGDVNNYDYCIDTGGDNFIALKQRNYAQNNAEGSNVGNCRNDHGNGPHTKQQ